MIKRKMIIRSTKKEQGFTLFELLVVISIIAVLVAIGTVSYSNVQKKGRDAKAKMELKNISVAFEQYFVGNEQYNSCSVMAAETWKGVWPPLDPKGKASGESGYSYNFTCQDNGFCLCALMEGAGTGNASSNNCPATWASKGNYFCTVSQRSDYSVAPI